MLVFLNPLLLLLLFPLLWLETKHWFYPQRPYNGFSMHQWDIKQLCAKMFPRTSLFPSICIIMMARAPPQLQQVSEPNELNHVNNKMQLYNKAAAFTQKHNHAHKPVCLSYNLFLRDSIYSTMSCANEHPDSYYTDQLQKVFSLFVTYLVMNVSTYSLFCLVKLDEDWSTYKLNITF